MTSAIVKNQRKIIEEFNSFNDLYRDRLKKNEETANIEKEKIGSDAKNEKSALLAPLQELQADITRLKIRTKKSGINVNWVLCTSQNAPIPTNYSSKEQYYQSLKIAKTRVGSLELCFSRYDQLLAIEKKKRHNSILLRSGCIVFIVITIIIISLISYSYFQSNQNAQATAQTQATIQSLIINPPVEILITKGPCPTRDGCNGYLNEYIFITVISKWIDKIRVVYPSSLDCSPISNRFTTTYDEIQAGETDMLYCSTKSGDVTSVDQVCVPIYLSLDESRGSVFHNTVICKSVK